MHGSPNVTDYERILENVLSLHWWITVVVVGLLINLSSAYLKPHLDRWRDNRSTARKRLSDAKRAELEKTSSALAEEPALVTIIASEIILLVIMSIGWLSFGFAVWYLLHTIPSLPVQISSFLILFTFLTMSVIRLKQARERAEAIQEAKNKIISRIEGTPPRSHETKA